MTPDIKLAVAATPPKDQILELQRSKAGLEFERFINLHAGCEGYQYSEPIAACATHGVSSAPRPEGYIYK